MARVLVAGGRGFIGRRAAAALAASHDVAAAGREEMRRPPACDVLVWAAGRRGPDPDEMREEHVRAPLRALAAAAPRRMVYLSSGEVYGAQAVPFGEDAPLLGRSAYALAKIEAESALAGPAELLVLRLAVVYGPGQTGPAFLPSALAALRGGRRLPMTAGEQTRDFVHVDDVVALIARAVDGPPGVYNAGTGREVRLRDACRLLSPGPGTSDLFDIGALPYRDGEQMRYALDPARAAARLGWRAEIALEDGLRRLVSDPDA